jgi:hypothetical protein
VVFAAISMQRLRLRHDQQCRSGAGDLGDDPVPERGPKQPCGNPTCLTVSFRLIDEAQGIENIKIDPSLDKAWIFLFAE